MILLRATARCLASEGLKLKRTLALVLAVVLPSIPAALQALSVVHNGPPGLPRGVDPAGWFVAGALGIWCALLPLFVALETSLVAGIEHQNQGWRRLLTLPVPRSAVYLAKFATSFTLVTIGFGILLVTTYAMMRAASWARPDAGLGGFPWADAFWLAVLTWAAAAFLLTLHAYVALRWHSYSLNISLAIVGIVLAVSFLNTPMLWIYPWSLPSAAQSVASAITFRWGANDTLSHVVRAVLRGLLCAGGVFVFGGFDLIRRDVP